MSLFSWTSTHLDSNSGILNFQFFALHRTLESGFGDFQSNSSFSTMVTQQSQTVSVTSLNSNMSLLSQAPPLQPQMMASIPPSGNLMQPQQQIMQPIQPSQVSFRPPLIRRTFVRQNFTSFLAYLSSHDLST